MSTALAASPIYRRLHDRLRALLADKYGRGDRFLTEREIVDRFEVSRPTANKVLAGLVSEGLLEFRKGIGTFVRCDAIDYDLGALVSFTNKARAAGKTPATRLLKFGTVAAREAGETVRDALAVADDDMLWEMERLRLADGVPVILERRYVVQALCPKLTRAQASGSLYRAWTETHGLTIVGADDVILAVNLKGTDATQLDVPRGTPAFEVTGLGRLGGGRLDDERPLWWERTLYRGDQYQFHSRLGPVGATAGSTSPTRGALRNQHTSASSAS